MKHHHLRRTAAAAALTAVAAGAVLTASASASSAASDGRAARTEGADLATVRAATAKYHDVSVAEAAGYVPVGHCVSVLGAGAMGVHYLHPGLASDAEIDPLRPEVLLYIPDAQGRQRLVAVEYFVAEDAVRERPSVLGMPFDGPMDGHEPGMPRHYDLHLWLWAHNPAGVATAFNPALSCGDEH